VLFLENGDSVSIFPCGDFTPRALPLADCAIGCFYSITKEQIKQIADNGRIKSFVIHISSDTKILSAQIDEEGTMFFEYEITTEKYGAILPELAACILNK